MKKPGKNRTKNIPAFHEPDVPEGPIMELLEEDVIQLNSSRRNFLKVFGFSFVSAALLNACKKPVRKAIPYAIQPPELIPRKPLYFASTFFDGHEYCSVLVKTIDGRPIKIEGNALSPFNGEATTARVQASVLSLYDDARLKFPQSVQGRISWEEADEAIIKEISNIKSGGKEIVLLTPTIISPSTTRLIESFGSGFTKFRWVRYDPVSYSAVRQANEVCFGKAVFPDYNFQNADLVLSVNCDFLGTWGVPVHFIPKYVSRRRVDETSHDMLFHIQYEASHTLTGSNADKRLKLKPSAEKSFLTDLYNKLSGQAGKTSFREDLSILAERLLASKGRSIVVSGTNNTEIQIIVNGINNLLGNYAGCIDLNNPVNIGAGDDIAMEKLITDLSNGSIGALFMYNVNPVYDSPGPARFAEGLSKTSLTVNMSVALNETFGKSKYECPVSHYLESWDDAEIIPGQLSIMQPCINSMFDTRSFQDSLLKWSGSSLSWHDYLASSWEKGYFPRADGVTFSDFWIKVVGDGVFSFKVDEAGQPSFNNEALMKVLNSQVSPVMEEFEIILAESIALGTGMHANNPWLMELPDPVTRHCWENVALISLSDADKLGIADGQLIKVGEEITIPALRQPGQAEGTITIFLGYGHQDTGPVASGAGINVFPLAKYSGGNRIYSFVATGITATPEVKLLGLMQMHNYQEGRPLARETTLSEYIKNPASGNELHIAFETMHKSLYPDAPFDGFHWAIAIDLNACIGCNTCVIACQAENNTPTVGKDEVRRNRIMHWIKVHRYYSDDDEDPKVSFQPVFCQQCDDAPCENVCPVSATNHSNEGLNQMAYNRCVGTKYCMNNCPYRVRRFNWFRYTNNEEFDYNTSSDLGKMVLNPDVTVRERGVVEKCTFCVQRIQAVKLEAKLAGRRVKDLEIKTACMQACPAGAIVFGDLNDPGSRVSQFFKQQRRYALLEELHTLPSIGFLTKVRNDDPDIKKA